MESWKQDTPHPHPPQDYTNCFLMRKSMCFGGYTTKNAQKSPESFLVPETYRGADRGSDIILAAKTDYLQG